MNKLIANLLIWLGNLVKGGAISFEIIDPATATTTGSLQYDTRSAGTLNFDNLAVGVFAVGETITGGTSGATAVVEANDDPTLTLSAITGTFQNNEQITGGTSGATADVNGTVTFFDFEVGDTVTGGTSSATGVVTSVTSTELELSNVSGTFQNNEVLTGSESGAEALADGTLKYNTTGAWFKIKANGAANCLIDKIWFANGDTVETVQLNATDELTGNITAVRITSGKLIAFKNPPVPTS